MSKKLSAKKIKEEKLTLSIIKQMLQLSTAAFGLVAALAWNDLIKTFINDFIKPYTPSGSVIASQAIYVLIVTILAVSVTYYLTKIKNKFLKDLPDSKTFSSEE